jgi:hypothetical protein
MEDIQQHYYHFLKDERVKRLEIALHNPNIFEILQLQHYEIRHSNFLAWLLDPNGNHGLGDAFLKHFLLDVLKDERSVNKKVSDINKLKNQKCKVYRELENIDLVIAFDDLVIAIENKIKSKEHSNQLEKYIKVIEERFVGKDPVFVFLTPSATAASLPDRYISYGYDSIVQYLSSILAIDQSLSPKVRMIINDYIESMNRNVLGVSPETQEAMEIYREHKELIDFIYKSRSNLLLELRQEIVNELPDLEWTHVGSANKTHIRMVSKKGVSNLSENIKKRQQIGEFYRIELYFWVNQEIVEVSFILPKNPESPEIEKELRKICNYSGNTNDSATVGSKQFKLDGLTANFSIETYLKYKELIHQKIAELHKEFEKPVIDYLSTLP